MGVIFAVRLVLGFRGFGAVGKAGELRLLGAFFPEPIPQREWGVPWAPSPLVVS